MDAIKMVGTSVIEEIESAVDYFYKSGGYTNDTVRNLVALAAMESGLDPYYKHPTASAEGLFAITADVRHKYGGSETLLVHNQVATALRYIQDRYKNTDNALNFRVEKGFW